MLTGVHKTGTDMDVRIAILMGKSGVVLTWKYSSWRRETFDTEMHNSVPYRWYSPRKVRSLSLKVRWVK